MARGDEKKQDRERERESDENRRGEIAKENREKDCREEEVERSGVKGERRRATGSDWNGTRRAHIVGAGVGTERGGEGIAGAAREDIDIFGRGPRIAAGTGGRAGGWQRGGRRSRLRGARGVCARRGSRLSLPDPAVSMATSSARISRERPEA